MIENLVKNSIAEIRAYKDCLDMANASTKLNELSILHASLTEEIANAENRYNIKYDEILNSSDSAKKAEIKSKATPEYFEFSKLSRLEKSLIECIRSLKVWIKIRGHEWETSFNQ